MKIKNNRHTIITCEYIGYEGKYFRKREIAPYFYLNKKGFNDFTSDSDRQVQVAGDVFVNQRRYKDPEKYEKQKKRKGIIGVIDVPHNEEHIGKHPDDTEKKYDLYKQKQSIFRRCVGYAELDNHQFVRLVRFNALGIILLLLLAVLLMFMLKSYPKIDPIIMNQGQPITDSQEAPPKDSPVCYYVPFDNTTVLTSENPCITLTNVKTNDKNYYISFAIVIDGVAMKDENGNIFTTGAISPDRQVNINLWKELDEGAYQLEAIATDYDYAILSELNQNKDKYSDAEYAALLKKAKMPISHTLSTELIVKK